MKTPAPIYRRRFPRRFAFILSVCLLLLVVVPGVTNSMRGKKERVAANESATAKVALLPPSSKSASVPAPQELAQWATQGKFSAPVTWPTSVPLMVHATMLPDGRILFWGRTKEGEATGNPNIYDLVGSSPVRIWNPATDGSQLSHFETVDNGSTNLFCSGHSLLPDGRLFAAGGHAHRDPSSISGDKHTNIFDPVSRTWAPQGTAGPPQMQTGRWYPFTLALENGKIAILSGTFNDPPSPNYQAATKQLNPEIYDPQTNTLEVKGPVVTEVSDLQLYPMLFLDPMAATPEEPYRGVLVAGPNRWFFWNPNGAGSRSDPASHDDMHQEGSAVMYDGNEGKILLAGGRSWTKWTTRASKTITLNNQVRPQWVATQPMIYPRTYHTLTVLPDGKVLATGGVPCTGGITHEPCGGGVPIDLTQVAEMWNPDGGAWTAMAKSVSKRAYHSTALLLPDATVLVAGGGRPDGMLAIDGSDTRTLRRHKFAEPTVEVYSPPYLFDAAGNPASRPSLDAAPTVVGYGEQFNLTFSNAAAIDKVALIRLPSVTHGFNTDQRRNVLNFSAAGAGQLSVTAPSDERKTPPGYYMMFIMEQRGTAPNHKLVPSIAKIIKIHKQPVNVNGEDYIARRAVRHNERIHVFYRHLNDTALRYISQTAPNSNAFNPPVNLGGGLNSDPIAIRNQDGRLQVFMLGLDNSIYTNQETAPGSGNWTGFSGITTGAKPPAIAGARNVDGRIQIFFRGSDNALWYILQTEANVNNWTKVSLGGGLTSEPAVGMNPDGRLEVFVRGLDNALYLNRQSAAGGPWSGFFGLGGQMTSGPFVAHQSDGRLDVFVRGTDSGVWHIKQSAPNSTTWSGFQGLGGVLQGDHQYNSPSAALGPDGRLQVFVRWNDNSLRTLVQNSNGTFPWNAWNNLGGYIESTVPPPARNSDGRLFVFVRGGGGALFFNSHNAPNSYLLWNGFAYFGDAAQSF
jgi:hypothetical protein